MIHGQDQLSSLVDEGFMNQDMLKRACMRILAGSIDIHADPYEIDGAIRLLHAEASYHDPPFAGDP